MLKFFWNSLLVIAALVILNGCGKKDEQPNPAPPPPPPPSAPAPTTQTAPGTNCNVAPGEVPMRRNNEPFVGTMSRTSNYNYYPYNYNYTGSSNSLSLVMSYVNYAGADATTQSIVASGSFTFNDLSSLTGVSMQNQNTTFCVTSASTVNGAPSSATTGIYAIDRSVAIVVRGQVQVPLVSPFNYPYGYQQQQPAGTGTENIEVAIGNEPGCDAWLMNGRIVGCVRVSIGNQNYNSGYYYGNNRLYYQSR